MPQETTFRLGCWGRVKRFLANSKIVKPTKEVERQMRQLTVLKAICVPLAIAAADIATDTGFLFNMWSYILNPEVTDASGLIGVRMASIFILVLSVINMVTGNPAKTLIRNAHTEQFSWSLGSWRRGKSALQLVGTQAQYSSIFDVNKSHAQVI